MSIFALGIMPYISASIIMQLMTAVSPQLEQRDESQGEAGRRKISQYTCYGTVISPWFKLSACPLAWRGRVLRLLLISVPFRCGIHVCGWCDVYDVAG